jgi:predicted enzyme related to lactoylglutathione lyase
MADAKWNPGMFVWRELMTADPERARGFYGELFGWTWHGEPMGPAGTYWLASAGGRQVAGVTGKPPGVEMPSAWSSYVLVDDVDAAADRCRAAGGRVLRAPADIPNVGRFAVLADPWGAVLQPFRPSGSEEPPPTTPTEGAFCWETLVTPGVEAAVKFYGWVLGLGTAPTPDGEMTMFTAGGVPVADVQPAGAGAPARWATYVMVGGAEATRDRAAQLGGQVLVPRIDVPKVGVVSVIADPDGAALGLFQPDMARQEGG